MTITQVITALPPAPDPAADSPAEFSQKAANSVLAQRALPGELNAFGAQANALAQEVTANAIVANVAAVIAEAAIETVEYTTGMTGWVSGKAYQRFDAAISLINSQVYRRTAAGSGTVDPANDTTGTWVLRAGNGAFVPLAAPTATFDLSRSSYFKRTVTGNETWVFDKCPAEGFRFFVEVDLQAGVLGLPTSVKTSDDIVYTMTTGKVQLMMFVTSNRGARWRMVVAPNFTP
jgi:hypothetical protein